jgi:hypothetical protein
LGQLPSVYAAALPITAVPSDNVTFECKIDWGAFAACTSPRSLSSLGEGQHTFTVQATRLGSVSNTSRTWTVDSIAPASPSLSGTPASGALVNTTAANFTFSATDANTITYECSRDGGAYTACTSPQMFTVTGDGSHSFAARAKDPAGNTTTLGARSWTLDATPPNTTLTQNIITATNQTSVTFTYSGSEANSTFACTLDGVARSCTGTSHTITGLSIASHTFSIAAVDAAGNVDASPATHAFEVTQQPVLRYAFENANAMNTGAAGTTGYTGTLMNVTFVPGKSGNGVMLQGSATSFVTLPVSPLIHTGRAYSVSIWFLESASLANGALIRFPGANRLESYHTQDYRVWENCVSSIACAGFEYSYNVWHNLSYSYAGAGNSVNVYTDGRLVDSLAGPPGDLFAALGDPTIGAGAGVRVDEIRFFDKAYPIDEMCTVVLGGSWTGTSCTLP